MSSQLSRRRLDDGEFEATLQEITHQSDRGAGIMAAALVEHALVLALKGYCVPEESQYASWFYDEGAPFKTFNARIRAGRARGLYGAEIEADLHIIRDIRNQFAHALMALDFTNDALISVCAKLQERPLNGAILTALGQDTRWKYISCCAVIAVEMYDVLYRKAKQIDDSEATADDNHQQTAPPE